MATGTETQQDLPASTLMANIVNDARDLFVEQVTLFKVEFKNDMQRTWMALVPLAIGLLVILIGLLVVGEGAALLFSAYMPQLPLWVGYVVVGGSIVVIGILLSLWGKSKLTAIKPLDSTVKGLEENVTWKTKN
jgi:hypothetical protein